MGGSGRHAVRDDDESERRWWTMYHTKIDTVIGALYLGTATAQPIAGQE